MAVSFQMWHILYINVSFEGWWFCHFILLIKSSQPYLTQFPNVFILEKCHATCFLASMCWNTWKSVFLSAASVQGPAKYGGFLSFFNRFSNNGKMGPNCLRAVLECAGVKPTREEVQQIIDCISVDREYTKSIHLLKCHLYWKGQPVLAYDTLALNIIALLPNLNVRDPTGREL